MVPIMTGADGSLLRLIESLLGLRETTRALVQEAEEDPGPSMFRVQAGCRRIGCDRLLRVVEIGQRAEMPRGFGRLLQRRRSLGLLLLDDLGEDRLGLSCLAPGAKGRARARSCLASLRDAPCRSAP